MGKKIKILIVQNAAIIKNKKENFNKVEKLLLPYVNENIDLIVLPELWAVGWECSEFSNVAEDEKNSPTINFLKGIAQKYNANVAGGSYIKKLPDKTLRNSMPVFNRKGEIIVCYDKMHLYSYLGDTENLYITKGTKPQIAKLDIGNIGLSICYDIRFPEIFRAYTFAGADILLNLAAWPLSRKNHWITLQKARAIENQIFMVAVSQTGLIKNDIYNIGHSMVISPLGDIISSLEQEESTLFVEINLNEMYNLRKQVETLGDRQNLNNYKLEKV